MQLNTIFNYLVSLAMFHQNQNKLKLPKFAQHNLDTNLIIFLTEP